ncbi:hypothetical protein [Streptomyces sp. PSAA01]|uniref:hypothetical protein n=1 Tax=Streptomyces sp. PSAA01 TaxID=2912762 RepID=UPI001F1A71F3|nr:hypothetical protein [Streptomyces sp. PSAA01]MCG0286578.1 hypothetical protein [Streptomyces sp. PSAA01]
MARSGRRHDPSAAGRRGPRGLGLPVVSIPADEAGEHFGWLSKFYGADMAAGSDATRALLGWAPGGPTLAEDLDSGCYYR